MGKCDHLKSGAPEWKKYALGFPINLMQSKRERKKNRMKKMEIVFDDNDGNIRFRNKWDNKK